MSVTPSESLRPARPVPQRPPVAAGTETAPDPVLQRARERAAILGLPHAGSVSPYEAWVLHHAGEAVIVDVRTHEERVFVGQVPGTLHVPWATGTGMTRNPRFVRELESKVGKHETILLLCRSGKRSAAAAQAATKAGFAQVFNIEEGFEGERDETGQRGRLNGWRLARLPWVQD